MYYFVKTTLGDAWFWSYSPKVSQGPQYVTVHSPVAPIAGGPPLVLQAEKQVWVADTGWIHAYPIETPVWAKTGEQVPPKIPRWVAAGCPNGSIQAAVRYALVGSPLRKFFERDDLRMALAEELALDEMAGTLHTPIFLPESHDLLSHWAQVRPAAFAFAKNDAEMIASTLDLPDSERELRCLWRMEAHRKIDALREDFSPTPSLGSEPFVEMPIVRGFVRVGMVRQAYYPSGDAAAPVNHRAKDSTTVDSVENSIWPGPGSWSDRVKWLPWCRKVQAFEAAQPYPALKFRPWVNVNAPDGFIERLANIGSPCDVAAFGVSPFVSTLSRQLLDSGLIRSTCLSPTEAVEIAIPRAWRAAA